MPFGLWEEHLEGPTAQKDRVEAKLFLLWGATAPATLLEINAVIPQLIEVDENCKFQVLGAQEFLYQD